MARSQPTDDEIDDVDLAILAALSSRADITNKALAARLHLAESTCAHRVRMLRRRGLIVDTRARVDTAALGFPLRALVNVRLGSHTKSGVTDLFHALTRIPGVIEVFHVAGEDDFVLHVAAADAHALRDLVLEHVTVHPAVRSTETHLVFDRRDGVGVLPAG
ncbi:Lrp/AsnC family transcriptional regulator [Microbacterium sp. zg.Y1090]|uniref:Lrp/AsnC family transcriptional regulator n=1 Tax=Microbacterium TaxID=33882 RepID=UPI00214C0CCE|nr:MULTISPECIES: Lrp/AsnC family transcriptional regulator [unclassified Microbacterium]MCR2812117.1 Lrp/AsnC family transcriptional regulator [Microbacterium sp. zg.Y1084]MCR2818445.1 Lrp/AsnC family transcriptional regulator [Microbacterium sp. zg.Y1090]MDL5486258.1 Lrp/AsnC family transcriptional regulator [Microbacterium sp. zg-Y1211]WIM29456.1 Lrp/AsnC family transcriptional regulator [Microbacterium sp. zg-Y1090]